jgi:hypothetical protein
MNFGYSGLGLNRNWEINLALPSLHIRNFSEMDIKNYRGNIYIGEVLFK